MPRITDTELSKQLRQNDPAPLYFLYGKETYLLERAAAAIIKKAVGSEPSAFNFQKFDSQKTPVEDIQNAADALPFMAQRKCVVVENLNVEAMSAAQHEKLTELVKGVYDSCVLIFYISAIEINIKKQAKWRAFAALCEKHGVVCEFEPKDKAALSRSLCERAKKRGCVLAPANAAYIIDISSRSLLTLNHEVDKLCDFADGGKITREMINLSVSPTVEASSFDLAKAVVRKNYGRAYSILNELFYQRIKPEFILGALTGAFIDLYRAKAALDEGRSAQDIITDFAYPKNLSFTVTNAIRDVKGASLPQLRKYISALSEADIKIKSSPTDKKIILEQLIGKMIEADRSAVS